jgi:hypothetical protein
MSRNDVSDFSRESQSFSGGAVSAIVAEYSDAIAAKGSATSSISDDSVLERLFSALAQLPDLSLILLETETGPVSQANTIAASTPVVDSLASLLPDAISCALYGSPESPRFLLPGFHEVAPVATQDRVALSEWTDGLRLVSRLGSRLSPTELHAAALSSVAFGNTSNDSDSGGNSGSTTFLLTCLLVCCEALRRCNLLDNVSQHKRWKRWQCMQLETLQLFQRIVISSHNGRTAGPAAWAVSVWCSYVLPGVAHVQQALLTARPNETQQQQSSSDNPRWMLYEAGVVACTARLAAVPTDLDMMQDTSVRLLESLHQHDVLDGSWTILYEHDMRKRALASISHRSKKPSVLCPQNAALARFTIASVHSYHSDDDSNDEDDDLYNLTLGVETQWSDVGIARLAILAGWKDRPYVWSVEYQWYLFLPHMNQLLLGDGDDSDDADDDGDDGHAVEEKRQRNESIKSTAIHAFSVLKQLLQGTPQYSMIWTKSRALNDYLGLFQLLANYMIAANMAQSGIGHDESLTTLPNATETFQLMKTLMEKYRPQCQVGLVRRLLEDCPHPGLRPKLIDLLRNFVFWENVASEDDVWALVADVCLNNFDRMQSTTLSANDVSRHVDNAEDYQAALGLLELWIMRKRALPLLLHLEDLRSRIQHAHSIVSSAADIALAADDEQNGDALPGHRFNLLESALQRVLDLIASIPDKASLDA